jgi:hypothetical protein
MLPCDLPVFVNQNREKHYQKTKQARWHQLPNLLVCAQHGFQEMLHNPPCYLIRSTSDLGQWLCVPRFCVVGLFQALLGGRKCLR